MNSSRGEDECLCHYPNRWTPSRAAWGSAVGTLFRWFRPTFAALFRTGIAWRYRWRLLLLQPMYLISNFMSHPPFWGCWEPFDERWIPTANSELSFRVLVYRADRRPGMERGLRPCHRDDMEPGLRPLHVDIHGGAFIGGSPETTNALDSRIAAETGAVVVSISYRYAPEHVFPVAHDDVYQIIEWLRANARRVLGADPRIMTISGFSAGGNLALAATHNTAYEQIWRQEPYFPLRAVITFYAPIDLRLKPGDKPRPEGFPKIDPLGVFLPLFDAYASQARERQMDNPRLNPTLIEREDLPEKIFMVVPQMDILVDEQVAFANRINGEDGNDEAFEGPPRVELLFENEGFHGYLELPDCIVKKGLKNRAFDRAIEVLRETHQKHGFVWPPE
ncbi:Fc.00g009170.m01.CDS01 [Cosmosporella sp. VM-42]